MTREGNRNPFIESRAHMSQPRSIKLHTRKCVALFTLFQIQIHPGKCPAMETEEGTPSMMHRAKLWWGMQPIHAGTIEAAND